VQIKGAGQGPNVTGGVVVQGGSTFVVNARLVIEDSLGQGLVVMGNSHAVLQGPLTAPVLITGCQHNGVVVANESSVVVQGTGIRAQIVGGMGRDLVCDSSSLIAGTDYVAYTSGSVQCDNLSPFAADPSLFQ